MAYSVGEIGAGRPYFQAAVADTPKLVNAGATILCSLHLHNTTAADAFLQCFNAAAVTDVTLGTTAPDFTVPLTANAITSLPFAFGINFPKGLVIAGTTTATGSTAAAIDTGASFG